METQETGKKILVADDEEGFREMYRFLLEPLGIKVLSVSNGAEAVEKVREEGYDLVLMDVHMPLLTGPEAFQQIKKVRPEQKVIMFSSSSDPENSEEKEVLKEGVLHCFYKPVSLNELEPIFQRELGIFI